MESEDYTWEVLYRATRSLVTGIGPICERLRDAYSSGLFELQPEQIPWPDLRKPLGDILDYFGPDGSDGTVQDADRTRIAGEIFDLYEDVCDKLAESDE